MRLNFDACCLYPLSISLRATDFETILRATFARQTPLTADGNRLPIVPCGRSRGFDIGAEPKSLKNENYRYYHCNPRLYLTLSRFRIRAR